jgi:putrescine transport system substrate-binding protein
MTSDEQADFGNDIARRAHGESKHARFAALAALLAIAGVLDGCSRHGAGPTPGDATRATQPRVLNVYQWADYFDPDVLRDFELETGIKVTYSTFDSQEVMEAKMLTGSSGYDVVDVASYAIDRLEKAGVFRKLDRARLRNWANLDVDLMRVLEQFDAQNQYAVGYLWGTTGVAYNARALAIAVPDAPLDSWALVFDPRYAARAARCGVSFNSDRMEIIGNALIAVGADPNHPTSQQLATAEASLQAIRQHIRRIDGPSQISDLSTGSMCLFVTAGTNVVIARRRNKDAGVDMDLRYFIPREGAVSWFDTLAIPIDAPHSAEAYEFLDYLLRPEVAARNANFTGSATVNRAALPFVDQSLRSDTMLYPDHAVRATLKPLHSRSNEQARAETRLWTRFQFKSTK